MPRPPSPAPPSAPVAVSVSIDPDGRSIIWVRGEHDLSTVDDLGSATASAVTAGEGDVIVDLHEASFIDASTMAVLARARVQLRSSGRDITIRAPSRQARFVIDVCGQSTRIAALPGPVSPNGNEPH